jgi:hypothetical protein
MNNHDRGLQPPTVSPNPLDFFLLQGSSTTLQEKLSNPGDNPLLWLADTGGTRWLSLDKNTSILQPGQTDFVNVTVDSSSLAVGNYEATLTFTSEEDDFSASVQVLVTLEVTAGLATPKVGLSFGTLFKDSSRSLPLLISNPQGQAVKWTVDKGGTKWLILSRSAGELEAYEQQTIFVIASSTALEAGDYAATLTLTNEVSGVKSAAVQISVDMHIGIYPYWDSGPHIIVSKQGNNALQSPLYTPALSFDTPTSEDEGSLLITNLENERVNWISNYGGVSWLKLSVERGSIQGRGEATCSMMVIKDSLSPGTYSASLLLSFTFDRNEAGREPTVIPILVTVTVSYLSLAQNDDNG